MTLLNSSFGTVSFWINRYILSASGEGFVSTFYTNRLYQPLLISVNSGVLNFYLNNRGTGTFDYRVQSLAGSVIQGTGWHHVLFSWDISGGSFIGDLFVDDVLNTGTISGLGASSIIEWSQLSTYSIFSDFYQPGISGSRNIAGCIGEFWTDTQNFLDLSVVTNRRKFIDSSQLPVYLGSSGELPTGTPPSFYHTGRLLSFFNNKGSEIIPLDAFSNHIPNDCNHLRPA